MKNRNVEVIDEAIEEHSQLQTSHKRGSLIMWSLVKSRYTVLVRASNNLPDQSV
jgi:hypothetical protein